MGFDSQANQGSGSREGADEAPEGTAGGGGYRPSPGFAASPTGSWQPPGGSAPGPSGPPGPPGPPGPAGPPGYGQPTYGAPSYPSPPMSSYGSGGYPPPAPPGYGPPPPSGGYGAYPTGYGYSGPVVPRTDGTAIAALVLAICSFLVCPVIPAVIALAMVPGARRTIHASGGSVSGLGVLSAAKVIAWINIGLAVVGIAIVVIIAIVSSASSSSNALAHLLTL